MTLSYEMSLRPEQRTAILSMFPTVLIGHLGDGRYSVILYQPKDVEELLDWCENHDIKATPA